MAEKTSPEDVPKPKEDLEEKEQEQDDASGWGGWFNNTFVTAKEKSNEMFQYLKQDFSEFSDTVQEAGRDLKEKLKLEDTAKTAVASVGTKMNTLLEQVSTIFGVAPEDDDEEIIVSANGPIVVDRVQAKIYSMALENHVFLHDPENIEEYEKWLAGFDFEEKTEEVQELMAANPHIQLHYTQLVPDKVSHLMFWHRFYFQVQQIFEAESRACEVKAKKSEIECSLEEEESPSGCDLGMVEISEEDQKRLLAEYEEEMKQGEDGSGRNSRRSSGTQLSSSSSGSFAFVTHDALTDEVKVE